MRTYEFEIFPRNFFEIFNTETNSKFYHMIYFYYDTKLGRYPEKYFDRERLKTRTLEFSESSFNFNGFFRKTLFIPTYGYGKPNFRSCYIELGLSEKRKTLKTLNVFFLILKVGNGAVSHLCS